VGGGNLPIGQSKVRGGALVGVNGTQKRSLKKKQDKDKKKTINNKKNTGTIRKGGEASNKIPRERRGWGDGSGKDALLPPKLNSKSETKRFNPTKKTGDDVLIERARRLASGLREG